MKGDNLKKVITLEHTTETLTNTHAIEDCKGIYCTIHYRSNQSMRAFPQHWRGDRGFMERICPHGTGHPDPDEIVEDKVHGCDGCCS